MTLFIVGGSQRTGTTLLQSILCSDPLTNDFIGEASYFRTLVECFLIGQGEFESSEKYVFKSLAKLQHFSSKILEDYLDILKNSYPAANHYVLKEPHLSFYFVTIYQLLKDVKFLVMVRDPRDVIASMLQVKKKLMAQNRTHFFVEAKIEQLIDHYLSFYRSTLGIENNSFQVKCLYIKYEDLVNYTDATLNRICLFTGLSLTNFDKNNPWSETANLSFKGASAWITSNNFKAINSNSIGLYKKVLMPSELQLIERGCRQIMESFGYK